jgi:hypothetical protein
LAMFTRNGTVGTAIKVVFFEDFLISNNRAGVQAAWLDMLLVTGADARVLTPGSSYSEFAWSMAHDWDHEETGTTTGPAAHVWDPWPSVFVKAANATTGPRMCYTQSRVVDPAFPFCVRPCTPEPSWEEENTLVTRSPCSEDVAPRSSSCPF